MAGSLVQNKVLGPWRTELRTATLGWLGLLWALALRHNKRKLPLLLQSCLALGLAWLPELLLLLGGTEWGGGTAPPAEGAQRVVLDIEGMGCEACQLHVRTVIETSPGATPPHEH